MMRFETSQQMKLGQQMKLSPRMIQSMEILQMPILALQERIDQELETNIALEVNEEEATGPTESDREGDIETQEMVVGDTTADGADDFARLDSMEHTYSEAFDNEYSSGSFSASRMAGERDGKQDAMASISARGERLSEQVLHQWTFAEVSEPIGRAGRIILEYLNDDGLLEADLETIFQQRGGSEDAQGVTPEILEEALQAIHHWIEPPGLAARSIKECLLLQVEALQRTGSEDNAAVWDDVRRLIDEHMDDLVQNRLPRIVQETGLDMERVREAMNLMHRLDLAPGKRLVSEDVRPILPDVIVDYDEERDEYIAALCDGVIPPLRVSPRYEEMSKDRKVDKETREFLGRSVGNARWMIESINQRKNSLLRVVNVVLTRQREYFDIGPQHLKPLPMVEVAEQLGIHVATVSRAVADKWLQTPRGIVPLRRFFSGGTETASGENMSWEAIKAVLQEIVTGEDKSHPLSDEAIAAALKEKGIDIARRTVVKYRQQLGIPPGRLRKQY
ncbi:MAG: RNA polymerase factor sigma-54 [Planctomycetota bacterium]|nr:RNA polymerase factor sigma-54 [Planctomycetota bacterium]